MQVETSINLTRETEEVYADIRAEVVIESGRIFILELSSTLPLSEKENDLAASAVIEASRR